MNDLEIEMQFRCVKCGREQWVGVVWSVSHGKEPCVWCGEMSKKMTTKEYREALKKLGE
jgi:uncharacterized CHY-type Zn-finger protein